MNSLLRRSRAVLLALLVLLLVPVSGAPPAHAERLGPGRVAIPGFSGYVTRRGAELGVARLRNGVLGICLDTGPRLRWPPGTPPFRPLLDDRVGYLTATYLGRASHDGRVAAALWWAVGGTLGRNSHPARVRAHVASLRAEAPAVYAAVRRWHDRMLAEARRDAPGQHGYTARLRLQRLHGAKARLSGIGVRSGSGHWVAGHRVRIQLIGARFRGGRTTWTGSTAAGARALAIRTLAGRRVDVRMRVVGLPSAAFRQYDAGGPTQRVAAAAPTVTLRASTGLAARPSPVRLQIVKSAELGDPAGLVGVAVAVHAGTIHGPLRARHTFTIRDVHQGEASFTTGAAYDPRKRYVVTITAEPAGWVPEATTVRASREGPGLVARLVDDRIWRPTLLTRASAQTVRLGARLHDLVTVADTGGDALDGAWRLLGPIMPGPAGCRQRPWSDAPVAASGSFAVIGDGIQVIGSHRVAQVGCYTYVEQLAGDRTTLPVSWTTPGVAEETTLVRAAPRLTTTITRRGTTAGGQVADRVRVSGLGPDVTPVAGRWQLLGPVSPNRHRTCRGLAWRGAHIAGHGTFRVRRNGVVTVGRRHLLGGGCYTYRERLAATAVSRGTSWTPPGLAAETVVVRPRQPAVPLHPEVPAGGARRAPIHGGPLGAVRLPATGLGAELHPVHFRAAALTPPADIRSAGLWREGAGLRAAVGTTVVVGHVSDAHDRPGAFHRLRDARVGQSVVTVATDGSRTRWRITRVTLTPKRAVPRRLFSQSLARRLVLITCGNEVHYPDGRFHYRSNLIVEAVPR